MLCRDIINIIEEAYPKHAALGWDNVGLLVGRMSKDVNKIYIAVDATDEVIEDAIQKGADLLVTHHPLIFSPLKTITDESFIGNRVVTLLQHDISYYAMHTNYDVLTMGQLAGEKLGLEQMEVLDMTDIEKNIGIGQVGIFDEKVTLKECCERVKHAFQLQSVRLYGNPDTIIKKVAIVPGSGSKMAGIAKKKGAQVIVTGDIGHHEGIDANAQNLAVIDAGHYGLEHIFIEDMERFSKNKICNQDGSIEVIVADIIHPFQVV